MVAQTVKNLPAMQETGFNPWVGKIPWRRKWQSIPVFLPRKSHGQAPRGAWRATVHGVTKSQTRLRTVIKHCELHSYSLHLTEKAMAPHSSTLAWKIPWVEEPGGLQSMGSKESDTTERLPFHFSPSCIGEGNGNPLQCSCLENPRDGGAWWAAVNGVAQSQTWLKWLSSSNSNIHYLYCSFIGDLITVVRGCPSGFPPFL